MPIDARRGTFVSRPAQRHSAVAMQGFPQLLCQSHPSLCISALAGWVMYMKAMARGCFPRGNVIYFRYQEGGCMTLVFPIPMLQQRLLLVWISGQLSLCWKILHTPPVSVSVHFHVCTFKSDFGLVFPARALSRAPSELAMAKQSYCK